MPSALLREQSLHVERPLPWALYALNMQSTFSKKELAVEQLVCAVNLYLDEEYVPAITLAGAAEEILGKLLHFKGHKNALGVLVAYVTQFWAPRRGIEKTEKQAIKDANEIKNHLKHFDGSNETVSFNPHFDAFLLIQRAIENYNRLGEPPMELFEQFAQGSRDF